MLILGQSNNYTLWVSHTVCYTPEFWLVLLGPCTGSPRKSARTSVRCTPMLPDPTA